MAHDNLTVSREVYEALVKRKELMREMAEENPDMMKNGRAPSLNDAVASFIVGSLTEGQYWGRRYGKRCKKDNVMKEITKTLRE